MQFSVVFLVSAALAAFANPIPHPVADAGVEARAFWSDGLPTPAALSAAAAAQAAAAAAMANATNATLEQPVARGFGFEISGLGHLADIGFGFHK